MGCVSSKIPDIVGEGYHLKVKKTVAVGGSAKEDGASPHTEKYTQDWCKAHLPAFIKMACIVSGSKSARLLHLESTSKYSMCKTPF
uniref:Protein kinase domain-containing protein n=1 Tax=Caenorhabditis japonica TaxID=281687 RepID=A0A8R1ET75_CAEJA